MDVADVPVDQFGMSLVEAGVEAGDGEATKELATLIAKQVKKGVKKQLAAADKKRKSGDDSDSDEDCAPLQSLTGAIDGFNCEQMENLCIDDDDDEVSC